MKIKYLGPSDSVNVGGGEVQKKDEIVEYPDDVGTELLETSKKQKFVCVEDTGPGGIDLTIEEKQTRKALEKKKKDDLIATCDSMDIKFPEDATKAVLVDLILENTAPEPEAE